MPLLNLQSAPRLDQEQNIITWCRDITDYLNRRTGQLILPFSIVAPPDPINVDMKIPAATLIGLDGSAGFYVSGIAGGVLGRSIILVNLTGHAIVYLEEDASSQPVNQIFNWGAGNFPANVVQMVHLGDNGSWMVISSR